jgi:hypothetical protein
MFEKLFFVVASYYNITPDYSGEPTNINLVHPGERTIAGFTSIADLIVALVNALLFFLFILTLIFVIYGGYMWLTALGNEERIGKAKKIVGWSFAGLFIVMGSYAIVATLTGNYFYLPYISPPTLTDSPLDDPGRLGMPGGGQ